MSTISLKKKRRTTSKSDAELASSSTAVREVKKLKRAGTAEFQVGTALT